MPVPDWGDILADIGDRVRAERQARGWSQTELAHRAGFALNTAKRLEEDGAGTLRVFALACAALGVQMSLLLSDQWRIPQSGPVLTKRQVEVLHAVSGGESLSVAAARLLMKREGVASHLSDIYRRLGVAELPRGERRSAAVRVARKHGLFNAA
jgi:transcriptional regulator with XRE-family HTH domain